MSRENDLYMLCEMLFLVDEIGVAYKAWKLMTNESVPIIETLYNIDCSINQNDKVPKSNNEFEYEILAIALYTMKSKEDKERVYKSWKKDTGIEISSIEYILKEQI